MIKTKKKHDLKNGIYVYSLDVYSIRFHISGHILFNPISGCARVAHFLQHVVWYCHHHLNVTPREGCQALFICLKQLHLCETIIFQHLNNHVVWKGMRSQIPPVHTNAIASMRDQCHDEKENSNWESELSWHCHLHLYSKVLMGFFVSLSFRSFNRILFFSFFSPFLIFVMR